VVPPTITILRELSWIVEKWFKRRGNLLVMLWLTEDAAGQREQFETACHAPPGLTDDAVFAALADEMRSDFRRDGVIRFALAFAATAVDFAAGAGPLADPVKQRVRSSRLNRIMPSAFTSARRATFCARPGECLCWAR
jgi:hypothetical protein